MAESSAFRSFCRCLCLTAVALSCCRAANSSYKPPRPSDDALIQEKSEPLFHLSLRAPTVTQKIAPGDQIDDGCKFVQVEISRITNPKRYALQFQLYYLPEKDEKVYLGSFSTYPADNPGKFIVATQGKVKNQGSLSLAMTLIDKPEPQDDIEVTLKKMICRRD